MVAFVVGEVFVVAFKHSEVGWEFLWLIGVFAKKDSVLVFFEEAICHARLASEFGDDRGDADMHVWDLVEDFAEFAEIVSEPAHVSGDEISVRVFFEYVLLLCDDLFPRRGIVGSTFSSGMRL